MKALEWSQHYTELYFRRSSKANSVVGGRVWWIINFIQAFKVVLVTCMTEEDPLKLEVLEWS